VPADSPLAFAPSKRYLERKHYVYIWADGVYFNIRSEEAKQCILVIIGVNEHGKKELIAIEEFAPNKDFNASEKSPVEIPFRYKTGNNSSILSVRFR
jgi:hypothetical protein